MSSSAGGGTTDAIRKAYLFDPDLGLHQISVADLEPDPHTDALRLQHPQGLAGRRRRRGCRPSRQFDAMGEVRQHLHIGAPPPRHDGRTLDKLDPQRWKIRFHLFT